MNNFQRTKPLVSIVIPSFFQLSHNGRYGLAETFKIAFESLKRLIEVTPKELYELILIDNGSEEFIVDGYIIVNGYNTKDYWTKADIVIKSPHNLGFAPAINYGMNVARGEYILAMNNDVIIWQGFLETMLKDIKIPFNQPVGALMPALYKGKVRFPEVLKLKKEDIDMTTNAGKFGQNAEFGSAFLMPRKVMEEIRKMNGGYEILKECFLCGMGEDRWCWQQIRMLGYQTLRTHNTRVCHIGNVTISKIIDRKKYTEKNREILAQFKKEHNIL